MLKTLNKDEDGNTYKPKGEIKQSGLSSYTLCKECNEKSGVLYDKDFSDFYNRIQQGLISSIKIPEGENITEYLEGKIIEITLKDIKPFNIAKRILVSFCSVEHPGLTNRNPEIKKAIQDKDYQPNINDFAIFISLHLGNSAYYGTIAAMKNLNGRFITQAYAGIESEFIALYYSGDKETIKSGLDNCTNITAWLTKYKYNQKATILMELMFNKSMNIRFPLNEE